MSHVKKTIIVTMIATMLVISTVGCQPPEISPLEIAPTMGSQPFTTIQPQVGNIPTYPIPVPGITPEIGIVTATTPMDNFGICSNFDEDAGKCKGDGQLGYRDNGDGTFRFYYDGHCYLVSDPTQIAAGRQAVATIIENDAESNSMSTKMGFEGLGWVATLVLALGVCGIISIPTFGVGTSVCILSVIVFLGLTGASLVDVGTLIGNYNENREEGNVLFSTGQNSG